MRLLKVPTSLLFWKSANNAIKDDGSGGVKTAKRIEDYPAGHPQFAALLSAYSPFFICRQFLTVRARLLLLKQDRISILEEQLCSIDTAEKKRIYLGKSRADQNTARIDIVMDLEARMSEYDQFLQNTHQILRYQPAHERDIRSLVNWVKGTGQLAHEETDYLSQQRDLICLASSHDDALTRLEVWIEDKVASFIPCMFRSSSSDVSGNPNIIINTSYQSRIRLVARGVLLFLIAALLLSPIAICTVVRQLWVRITIVCIFVFVFLAILLGLTRSKALQLTIASTTYAAVLIVFVSGNNGIDLGRD